jgi:cytochrome c
MLRMGPCCPHDPKRTCWAQLGKSGEHPGTFFGFSEITDESLNVSGNICGIFLSLVLYLSGEAIVRKCLAVFFCLAGVVCMVARGAADDGHTPEQAKAFVQKAVEYFKHEGKDKALAVFSDPKGEFVDGDLYLIVFDAVDGKLTMLAHGMNKALIGKPQIDMKDANGKAFNRETVDALATADSHWVTYVWPNPITKKLGQKLSYFVKVGDVIIGAGVYN